MEKIVIIGNGITAINAIKAIREVNPEVGIDVFGEERFYPYNRIKLTKSLLDQLEEEAILLQKRDWYDINQVKLHLDLRVQGVDVTAQEVILPQQERIRYDKLLLANGARNRPPGIDLAGSGKLHTIRTLEDVRQIHREIEGKTVILNIGGGIQGLETAWVLRQQQKTVVIAEIQNRLFPYQLDERAAAIVKGIVEAAGVEVLTNAEVVKATTENGSHIVDFRDGKRLPCDMVLYATGIAPNIDILKGTPVETGHGVRVNERMETSVANIYAAGDVAEFEGKVYGLWNIAVSQGKTAGYNMVNQATVYQPVVPVTTLNAFGIALFSMGDVSEAGCTQDATPAVIDEDAARHTYRRIFTRDNVIRGAIVIGDTSKSPLLKNAIEQKIALDDVDWARITVDELMDKLKLRKK